MKVRLCDCHTSYTILLVFKNNFNFLFFDVATNKGEESLRQQMGDVLTFASFDTLANLSNTEEEPFYEFMMWSLSEKVDLTPKKFERIAIAKMMIEGQISSDYMLSKRSEVLGKLECQINTLEMLQGINLLTDGIEFDNRELAVEFRSKLVEVLERKRGYLPMHLFVYDSFQEVVSKFSNERGICLNECLFFELPEDDFDKCFHSMIKDMVSSYFRETSLHLLHQNYYTHRSQATKDESFGNLCYAQSILVDVLKLFEEMHSCWRCKRLHLQGEGKQAKTLVCASCKCAVYCSLECQRKHWRDSHKECCENIGLRWSLYEANKRRVGKALRKGRIFTKPIIVNGVKRECFLRPSEKLDYALCQLNAAQNTKLASMDILYENIARLACGGTHPVFDDDTLSLQLQEKMSTTDYEDFPVDFDHGIVTEEKIISLFHILEILMHQTDIYDKIAPNQEDLHCYELSVDHFITLYTRYKRYNMNDRFRLETGLLQRLKKCNEKMQVVDVCKNDKVYRDLKESNPDEKKDEDKVDCAEKEATFRCPILLSYMKKPMRNTICGHVYDDEGITFVYKTKKSCPIAGCGKPFHLNDLEEDVEMAMKLRKFQK